MIVNDNPKLRHIALTTRRRIAKADELGEYIIGESYYGDENPYNGIFQMRMTKRGKRPVRMCHYFPAQPNTEAQQHVRENMRTAVAEWHNLTDEQKKAYKELSKFSRMTGFNLYIRTRLLSMV